MKAGWEVRTLGEVCEFKPNKAQARQKIKGNELVSFSPMENLGIQSKWLKPNQTRVFDEVVKSYTYFADGDVLLAKITPCFENGKIGIASGLTNGVGFGSSEYLVLRPNEFLNVQFLYHFLDRHSFRIEGAQNMSGAVGHKRLSNDFIENYKIPLPPLAEQERIVSVLDQAFEHIVTAKAAAQANLANAKALFESHLNGLKADTKALGHLVNITTGKLDANAAVESGEYPFFTCSRDVYAIDKYAFDCEAILLAGNNAVGDFNVKHYNGKFNAYQRTYVITVNSEKSILYRFLYYQMLNSLKAFKGKSVGAGTKFLKLGMIKDMQILLPSLAEQGKIVDLIDNLNDQTRQLEALYQAKLSALDALKQSLLHQAFSGAL